MKIHVQNKTYKDNEIEINEKEMYFLIWTNVIKIQISKLRRGEILDNGNL